jgi:hypothetical protein
MTRLLAAECSRSGVCWVSELHADAVQGGINIACHVVLSAALSHDRETGTSNRPAPIAGHSKGMLSGLPSRWISQRKLIAMKRVVKSDLGPWFGMVGWVRLRDYAQRASNGADGPLHLLAKASFAWWHEGLTAGLLSLGD